jgi:hypothetical protein
MYGVYYMFFNVESTNTIKHPTTTLACLRGELFFCFFVWPHLCTYQATQYTALASLETHKSHRQARLLNNSPRRQANVVVGCILVGIVGCEQFRLRFEVSADRKRSPTFLVVRHM